MGIFETYIYQPFFNILVGLYWLVGQVMPPPDMGIAVILFAVAVRLILLPIDLAGERSEEDKLQISQKIHELQKDLASDPVKLAEETKKTLRQSPGAIISEVVNIVIQLIIILMLYRIFTTGLEGADLHLLYKFMPNIRTPINLMFLGKYDLSHTNTTLNIIQSLMIGLNEILHLVFAPVKASRKDFISLVVLFPIVAFILFLFLPAGKKVFIITSLAFSIVVKLVKQSIFLYYKIQHRFEAGPAVAQTSGAAPQVPFQAASQPPLQAPSMPNTQQQDQSQTPPQTT